MPGSFFDTNILVYLAAGDSAKADRAEQVLASGGTVSVQVLNELANVARRTLRLSWPETRTLLSTIRAILTVVPNDVAVHATGLALAERHNFALYDAMIAAAALHADCDTLWSEDMQPGTRIENRLTIANPFQPASRA